MRRAVIVAILVALAAASCRAVQSAPDPGWQAGTCMHMVGTGDNLNDVGNVPCSQPHTHVVVGRVARAEACPAGSDEEFDLPNDIKYCFRVDTQLRSDAP